MSSGPRLAVPPGGGELPGQPQPCLRGANPGADRREHEPGRGHGVRFRCMLVMPLLDLLWGCLRHRFATEVSLGGVRKPLAEDEWDIGLGV